MFFYLTLGSNDLARSKRFYDPVLKEIGFVISAESDSEIGYGPANAKPGERARCFYLTKPYLNYPATWGNGTLVAFKAESRAAVNAFHEAALANGGQDDGAPGLRPYHASFYSCYVRDPDGNKLSAVCEKPE
ncbi:VOC family protein [Aestuariivirga sp.]|uniref:VOC family protein n=1 Tax=Aestuariivirga sp. TaxID=2650926 RepID=UPI0039E5C181